MTATVFCILSTSQSEMDETFLMISYFHSYLLSGAEKASHKPDLNRHLTFITKYKSLNTISTFTLSHCAVGLPAIIKQTN